MVANNLISRNKRFCNINQSTHCQEWARGAEATVAAEFPSWHLLSALDVFDLGGVVPGAHANPSLEKLAMAFRLNATALKEEYTSILPMALALKKKTGKDNRSVWAECLTRVRDRKLRQKFPQGQLYPVIAVYMAWTCSSSGVEQMFSKLKRSPVEGANGRADTDRRICAVVGTTPDKVLDEMLLKDAQAIYVRLSKSGTTRTARRARIDCMSKRPGNNTSERGWMRKRSEAVLAVAKMRAVAAASTAEMDALPDKARKEAERQKLIAAKRKAEAWEDGLLLPAETTAMDIAQAQKQKKQDNANDRARHRVFQQRHAAVAMSTQKQTVAWALTSLPKHALLVDCGGPTLLKRLKQVGVSQVSEDRRQAYYFML